MSEPQSARTLPTLQCQLLIVGAGPSGIAASLTAAAAGKTVLLIDQQQDPGGQVWRGQWRQLVQSSRCSDALAQRWLPALQTALHGGSMDTLVFRGNCRVVYQAAPKIVVADGDNAAVINYEQVMLCAGAREVYLPFPGWTLPGVTGVGGLQVMVKDGVSMRGKRVVVAGTGPLLMAVAASLQAAGATVDCILEQASRRQVWAFALQLWRYPRLLWQAVQLRWRTRDIPWRCDSWITAAEGSDRVANVQWRNGSGKQGRIACAALACGFSLTENAELLALFGGQLRPRAGDEVSVETDLPDVFIAGELLGIAGVRRALISGQLAAATATADMASIPRLKKQLRRWQPYVAALGRHFALRAELTALAEDKTLLCRCENISVATARAHAEFRDAKLATRIGMGACQGRICGSACRVLFGWAPAHTRAPLFPTPIRTLMAAPVVAPLPASATPAAITPITTTFTATMSASTMPATTTSAVPSAPVSGTRITERNVVASVPHSIFRSPTRGKS